MGVKNLGGIAAAALVLVLGLAAADGARAADTSANRPAGAAEDPAVADAVDYVKAEAALVKDDFETAVRLLITLAEKGMEPAQFLLGIIYESGGGQAVPQNYPKAIELYRKLIAKSFTPAAVRLADMLREGRGITQDFAEAFQLYRLASEKGNSEGDVGLGIMYADALGVAQDFAEAMRLFRKAAQANNTRGSLLVGFLYDEGHGVPEDVAIALQWYLQAARSGNSSAQLRAGEMYEKGQGTTRNVAEARRWYEAAAKLGDERATQALAALDAGGAQPTQPVGDVGGSYYMVENGQAVGPLTFDELKQRIMQGTVSEATQIARVGDQGWSVANAFPELQQVFEAKKNPPPAGGGAVYYVSEGGKPVGPLTLQQLKARLQTGASKRGDLVWRQDMPNWVEVSTVPELAADVR